MVVALRNVMSYDQLHDQHCDCVLGDHPHLVVRSRRNYLQPPTIWNRQGKISRSKVVVMFKIPKAPVTPGFRPGYDLPATEKCWNRGQIVERTYDWSQRSWVIARAKPVVAKWTVMFKPSNLRFQIVWCHE